MNYLFLLLVVVSAIVIAAIATFSYIQNVVVPYVLLEDQNA